MHILLILAVIGSGAMFAHAPITPEHWPASYVVNLALFTLVIRPLHRWLGWKKASLLVCSLGLLAFAIETIGLKTGYPYGVFSYGDIAGPLRILGTPLLAPIAWLPLALVAVVVSQRAHANTRIRLIIFICTLVLLDAVIDPGAVARGMWSFREGGAYYNVPFSNYIGWIISSGLAGGLALFITRGKGDILPAPTQLMRAGYLSLALWTGVTAAQGFLFPALIGLALLIAGNVAYRRWYFPYDDRIVLTNEKNEAIGTGEKLPVHTEQTHRHRGFSLFIFNSKGEILLQQRSMSKKTWPGIWSNSCCGHPMLHENPLRAAQRRAKYELGLSIQRVVMMLPDYQYRATRFGIVENEFCPVMVAHTDSATRPRPSEVMSVKYMPWHEFVTDTKNNPDQWSEWCVEETQLLNASPEFQQWFLTHCTTQTS